MTPLAGGLRLFTLVWFGQLVSLVGTGLTNFALGLWIYKATGSVTDFALLALCGTLPGVLLSPFAGVVVDRWDRRHAMRAADAGAGLVSLAYALLIAGGHLQTWHVYLGAALASACGALQWPAYAAMVPMLVPEAQLGRANGMVQTAQAAFPIVAPPLAGVLVQWLGVAPILLVDFATFLFAVGTVSLLPPLPPPRAEVGADAPAPSFWSEALAGFAVLRKQGGLLGLLAFFAALNFTVSAVEVSFTPLVLELANPGTLGALLALGGGGMLLGGLALTAWGGPRRRIDGVLGFGLLAGASLVLAGLVPRLPMLGAASFVVGACVPIINGCSQEIWQRRVAPELHGRVFSIRAMVAWSTAPLAYALAGPLVSLAAWSLGTLRGTAPTRAASLAAVILGVGLLPLVAAAWGYATRSVREIEQGSPETHEPRPER